MTEKAFNKYFNAFILIGMTVVTCIVTGIKISHAGGYETVYAHMESLNVHAGQRVRAGDRIGAVGMSGQAFAPHLHYEVRRNGAGMDPVGFFFASVSPTEYVNMLYMSVNTLQSMD